MRVRAAPDGTNAWAVELMRLQWGRLICTVLSHSTPVVTLHGELLKRCCPRCQAEL